MKEASHKRPHILFIWNIQKKPVHRARNQISGCQELEEGVKGKHHTADEYGIPFEGDENVLESDSSNDCMTSWVHYGPPTCTLLKWIMVCDLCPS